MFAVRWLVSTGLNLIYIVLVLVLLPVLVWKSLRTGKYRRGWGEKFFGRVPIRAGNDRAIWIHAVSVGEVLQVRKLVDRIRADHPGCAVHITTTTDTGLRIARKKYADCDVSFCPLDFSWAVRSAIRRIRPDLIVLVELELWPNLIRHACLSGVPLALINGRLSPNSFRGYRRIRWFVRSLLRRFSLIACQTAEYAARFTALGAAEERVKITGSIKFDQLCFDRDQPLAGELRKQFALTANDRVFVAGSTSAPDEEIALDAYCQLRTEFPDLRLVIALRHPNRAEEVAALVTARGLIPQRRSLGDCVNRTERDAVPILDTIGEMTACWCLAEFAFVGGSFNQRGGQNMLEPTALGAAVCFGPNTWNFADVVEGLLKNEAAKQVASREELAAALCHWLQSPLTKQRQSRAAVEFARGLAGATEQTWQLLSDYLPPPADTTVRAA